MRSLQNKPGGNFAMKGFVGKPGAGLAMNGLLSESGSDFALRSFVGKPGAGPALKGLAKRPRGGFTLVELTVVVVILAVIAAFALPTFTGYMDKYRLEEVARQARQMENRFLQLVSAQYAKGSASEGGRTPVTALGSGTPLAGVYGASTAADAAAGQVWRVPENCYTQLVLATEDGTGFQYGLPGGGVALLVVANSARASEVERVSSGINEVRRQLGLDLATAPPLPGNSANDTWSHWYLAGLVSLNAVMPYTGNQKWEDAGSVPPNQKLTLRESKSYLHTESLLATQYVLYYEGTWYLIMHHWKLVPGNGWPSATGAGQVSAPGEWYVYQNFDPNVCVYGSSASTPGSPVYSWSD